MIKVLLADDNITAQRMGCKILSDAGYIVVAVSGGNYSGEYLAFSLPN